MSEQVLVTGAGGFVAGGIVASLIERGVFVHALQRGSYPQLEALARQGKARIFTGPLEDRELVMRAAEGVTTIFHVAAKAGVWGSFAEYYRSNVLGTEHVLAAARAQGVRKFIFTSTPSVVHGGRDIEGIDESAAYATRYRIAYPKTKAIAEKMVLAENGMRLSTIALRPHLVWGPGDPHLVPRIIDRARRGRLVLLGGGTAKVDATYIDSAVHAHLCAWERLEPGAACAGRAYFIAQGEPMPIRDLINGILEAAELPPVHRTVDPRVAWAVGAILELAYHSLGRAEEPPMTRFVAEQLATSHWFDLGAARRELGYEAPVSTGEGLRRLGVFLRTSRLESER
jgi:nucleoside-diphosphate-sugar epimerase